MVNDLLIELLTGYVVKIRAKGRYGAVDNYRKQGLAAAGEAVPTR